jgi:Bacterial sugar transferase
VRRRAYPVVTLEVGSIQAAFATSSPDQCRKREPAKGRRKMSTSAPVHPVHYVTDLDVTDLALPPQGADRRARSRDGLVVQSRQRGALAILQVQVVGHPPLTSVEALRAGERFGPKELLALVLPLREPEHKRSMICLEPHLANRPLQSVRASTSRAPATPPGPVLFMVRLGLASTSPPPALTVEIPSRPGSSGTFRCLKIRRMRVDAEECLRKDPELYAKCLRNNFKLPEGEDPRITRLGRLLRKTSLDEPPQLCRAADPTVPPRGADGHHRDRAMMRPRSSSIGIIVSASHSGLEPTVGCRSAVRVNGR